MTQRVAWFLRLFAGWTVFVWVVFIRNVAKDHTHSSGFKAVHITLAIISLAFAAGCFAVVAGARRASGVRSEPVAEDPATSARPSAHR